VGFNPLAFDSIGDYFSRYSFGDYFPEAKASEKYGL
jgi:hypothetical protein